MSSGPRVPYSVHGKRHLLVTFNSLDSRFYYFTRYNDIYNLAWDIRYRQWNTRRGEMYVFSRKHEKDFIDNY